MTCMFHPARARSIEQVAGRRRTATTGRGLLPSRRTYDHIPGVSFCAGRTDPSSEAGRPGRAVGSGDARCAWPSAPPVAWRGMHCFQVPSPNALRAPTKPVDCGVLRPPALKGILLPAHASGIPLFTGREGFAITNLNVFFPALKSYKFMTTVVAGGPWRHMESHYKRILVVPGNLAANLQLVGMKQE